MVVNMLGTLLILLPVLALAIDALAGSQVAERHHRHHDTYTVPRILLSSLVVVMLFMGALGLILGWLCVMGVFETGVVALLSFFASFVCVMFLLWGMLRRYKVVTFEDRMVVTPFLGRRTTVAFALISSLERGQLWMPGPSGEYIKVACDDGTACTLWGVVDVEQILMRVDRFDALRR